MVPLNSWPMVMGRVSLVTGCGVVGEKLGDVGQCYVKSAAWQKAYFGPAKYSCRSGRHC
jgi:hypothetical protein